MWFDIGSYPKQDLWIVVQTTKDVYQCRLVAGVINWPIRFKPETGETAVRWTIDFEA